MSANFKVFLNRNEQLLHRAVLLR